MILRQLFLICCLLAAGALQAQPEQKNFVQYTTAEGLSHNNISGVVQDSMGYLWIATVSGLNRFNGVHFKQFHSNDDSLSLAAEEITELSWLDNHRLGAYTGAGLHIVDTRTGETRNLFVPYKRQNYLYKFNIIVAAKADDKGNIYVLTRSGFYHYRNFELVFRYDHYSEKDLANSHFHFGATLLELDSRRLLIVSIAGLFVYDKEKEQFKKNAAFRLPGAGRLSYQF